jgi:hypothetical protein
MNEASESLNPTTSTEPEPETAGQAILQKLKAQQKQPNKEKRKWLKEQDSRTRVQWGVPEAPTLLTSLIKHREYCKQHSKPSNFGTNTNISFICITTRTFREFGSGIVLR